MKTKITILGLAMSVFFALLAYIPFGFSNLSTPPMDKTILLYFFLVNLGLFLSYLAGYHFIKKEIDHKKIFKTVILFSIVFSIILLLIPPIGSADIYNYAFRARVSTVYNENPYLVTTEGYQSDLFYNYAPEEWNYLPMQYGPLWATISIGFSHLAQDSFFWNQFLYKLFALLVNLGIIYFVWRILSLVSPKYSTKGLFLYAWNPLILFEAVNNGHNDIFMIFLVVASIYLFLKKKYLSSFALLLLSVLVKYLTLLLLPVFLIYLFKKIPLAKERLKFLIKAITVLVIILILFYLPYWEGFRIFEGLFSQSQIKTFMNLSLIPSFIFGLAVLLKDVFTWSFDQIMQIVGTGGVILFIIIYLWQLRIIYKVKNDFIYRNFLILFLCVLFTAFFLQPWYFLWFLPLAVLVNKKYFPHFIFVFTLIGLFSYTFIVISILFLIVFLVLFFSSLFTKGRYFSSFLGFR